MIEYKDNSDIRSLIEKRRILEVLRDAFTKNITDKEILKQDYGLIDDEIAWFWNEIVREKNVPVSRLLPILDRAMININNELKEIISSRLRGFRILIFTKWHELVGARWAGTFKGQAISKLIENKIIILSSREIFWRSVTEKENMLLIGPGVYYCRFYLPNMTQAISWFKGIHGLLLPTKILEKAMRSPPSVYGKLGHYYRSHLITVALDFYLRDPDEAQQLKKLYIRIINENMSLFEIFLKNLREMKIEGINDLEILSALPELFNKILITEKRLEVLREEIEEGLPGLMGYEPALLRLTDLWNYVKTEEIISIINDTKDKFVKFGWEILTDLFPK